MRGRHVLISKDKFEFLTIFTSTIDKSAKLCYNLFVDNQKTADNSKPHKKSGVPKSFVSADKVKLG